MIHSGEDQPGARHKHLTKVNRHDLRLFSNKSIKSIANYQNRSKSIITRKQSIHFYRFLNINRLINIDYDRLPSIFIEYRKYRLVTSCQNSPPLFFSKWCPKFINGAPIFTYGALTFTNGALIFINGALSFVNGALSFVNGALIFINGALSFTNGALIFINGAISFVNGALTSINGALSLTNGALIFINGDFPFKKWCLYFHIYGAFTYVNAAAIVVNCAHSF